MHILLAIIIIIVTLIRCCLREIRVTSGIRRTATTSAAIASKDMGICHPVKQCMFPLKNHRCKELKIFCRVNNIHIENKHKASFVYIENNIHIGTHRNQTVRKERACQYGHWSMHQMGVKKHNNPPHTVMLEQHLLLFSRILISCSIIVTCNMLIE